MKYRIEVDSLPENFTGKAQDEDGKYLYYLNGKETPKDSYELHTSYVEVALVDGKYGAGLYISEPEKEYQDYILHKDSGVYYCKMPFKELIDTLNDQMSTYGYKVVPK